MERRPTQTAPIVASPTAALFTLRMEVHYIVIGLMLNINSMIGVCALDSQYQAKRVLNNGKNMSLLVCISVSTRVECNYVVYQ